MARDSRPEAELVKDAIAGDADAFGALYMRHLDAVYRYALLRVRNGTEAEDLTEQVFLRAWQAMPSYKQYGKDFIHWLYIIAHNLIVDFHRRRDSMHVPLSEEAESEETNEAPALDAVIQAEDAAALSAAIAQLPDEQQQVIILRFVEGLNHTEVARIIGKSEGACRVIQHRALLALSKLLVGQHV
jgi:RNA polymerase sigma-70 factor, ECF subfamily